jgi:hypothetical protein
MILTSSTVPLNVLTLTWARSSSVRFLVLLAAVAAVATARFSSRRSFRACASFSRFCFSFSLTDTTNQLTLSTVTSVRYLCVHYSAKFSAPPSNVRVYRVIFPEIISARAQLEFILTVPNTTYGTNEFKHPSFCDNSPRNNCAFANFHKSSDRYI